MLLTPVTPVRDTWKQVILRSTMIDLTHAHWFPLVLQGNIYSLTIFRSPKGSNKVLMAYLNKKKNTMEILDDLDKLMNNNNKEEEADNETADKKRSKEKLTTDREEIKQLNKKCCLHINMKFSPLTSLPVGNFSEETENEYTSFTTDAINVIYLIKNPTSRAGAGSGSKFLIGHIWIRKMVYLDQSIFKKLKHRNTVRKLKSEIRHACVICAIGASP
ncbi:hypothetical protein TSAR_001392 [Trichomalopsis sarcophagae]|uniref:Uncharacterized protein n=1 Tax=Trichomalopsis sarcophagae TaxID=543379 RepID=A0A232EPT0_9HYME|nr:hypothetical protein TSAR_001392 [Trichomalopsis sarcophagae]